METWNLCPDVMFLKRENCKHVFPFHLKSCITWGGSRVSIRKTFAQFLRNKTQIFSFVAHQFCAKKQQFAQSFAKVISRKIALFRFCATLVLRNSAISLGLREGIGLKCMFIVQLFKLIEKKIKSIIFIV